MGLAGGDEFAIRFPSLWAGVALIPVVFAVGRRLGGHKVGTAAACLAAISPPLIYHSQIARPYTLLTLLLALNFYAILRLRNEPQAFRWWALAVSTFIAAAYNHLYALTILPAMLLILGYEAWRKRNLRWHFTLSVLCIIGSLAPWMSRSLGSTYGHVAARAASSPLSPLGFADAARDGLLLAETSSLSAGARELLGVIVGIGILIGAYALWKRSNRIITLAAVYGVAPIIISYGLDLLVPYFNGRYLLFLAPLLYVVIAGVISFQKRLQLAIFAIPLLIVSLVWVPQTYQQAFAAPEEELDILATELHQRVQPGDILISNSEWRQMNLNYYLQGIDIPVVIISQERPATVDDVRNQVQTAMNGHDRVWVAFFGASPENATQAIEPTLSASYARVSNNWYGTTQLSLYERTPNLPTHQPANIIFGDALELLDYQLPLAKSVQPGASVVLNLRWLLHKHGDYAISLRLIDQQGQVWAQTDTKPRDGYLSTNTWPLSTEVTEARGLMIPWGTPPGIYNLGISVYNAEKTTELGANDVNGQAVPPVWILGSVEVNTATSTPSLDLLPIKQHIVKDLGVISLLGGSWEERASAGQTIQIELFWQAEVDLQKSDVLEIQLVDDRGQIWGKTREPLGGQSSVKWLSGEVREGKYRLRVSPTTPAGHYQVQLQILPTDQQMLLPSENRAVALGSIDVDSRPRRFSIPKMSRVSGTAFGKHIELLGYDLGDSIPAGGNILQAKAGDTIPVRLYWQADSNLGTNGIEHDYTVFVQVLDANGHLVAQHDGVPMEGNAPTTTWAPSEVIEDLHILALPPNLTPGTYSVIAGLYDSKTMERLPTKNSDHVILAQVLVR